MSHTRFLVPARLRRRLYDRRGAYWYWALVRNARDNHDELERIRRHMRGSGVPRVARWTVERRVTWLQRTAAPEPADEDGIDAILRAAGSVEDTTAYESPRTTITFLPGIGRNRRNEVGRQ